MSIDVGEDAGLWLDFVLERPSMVLRRFSLKGKTEDSVLGEGGRAPPSDASGTAAGPRPSLAEGAPEGRGRPLCMPSGQSGWQEQ